MRTLAKVGDLVDIAKGKKPSLIQPVAAPGLARLIQISDLRADDYIVFTSENDGVTVQPTDVCIAWDGANAGTVGYDLTGVIGSTIARLRPRNRERIATPYLGRFLQTKFAVLNGGSYGATIPHVSRDRLLGLQICLPSIDEQRRISAILEKADGIRIRRRAARALTDDLLRATFDQIVGEGNPEYGDWPSVVLESLAADRPSALRTGPFGSDLKHSEFTDDGVAVLGIDNAVKNRFAWDERRYVSLKKYEALKRYEVRPGDVIVTIMGTTGRSAVVPDDIPLAISTKHLATITPDNARVDPHFLSFAIHSSPAIRDQVKSAGKGAIMDGLNLTIIRNLTLRLPPLDLQRRFASVLAQTYDYTDKISADVGSGDAIYASLADRAFNGEL